MKGVGMSIPALSIERLIRLHKIQLRKRKLIAISNDMAREQYLDTERRLTRQATMVEVKTYKHSIPIEKNLVDMRGYYRALKEREKTKIMECKEAGIKPKNLPYGVYEGASHRDMRFEIEKIISENQPDRIRERKSKIMLKEGKKTGKLVEQEKVAGRFKDLMERKFDHRRGRLLKKGEYEFGSVSSRDTSRLVLPPMPIDRSLVNLNSRKSYMRTGLSRSVTYAPVPSPGA